MSSNKIAVAVLSCDRYSDLWSLTLTRLSKVYPSELYDIYLITDTLCYNDARVKTINFGEGNPSWSHEILKAVKQIPNDIILTTFDDLIVHKSTPYCVVSNLLDEGYVTEKSVLKLSSSAFKGELVTRFISKKVKYIHSLVFTLIRKELLVHVLTSAAEDNASPWEFETQNWDDEYICYELNNNVINYSNLVVKGKVNPITAIFCSLKLQDFHFLRLNRPFMGLGCIKHSTVEMVTKFIKFKGD